MSSFWERFREHAANLILITVVTGLLLAVLGTLATLALYNVALLLLVIYHWRQLAVLDKWLQAEESRLPSGFGKWGDV